MTSIDSWIPVAVAGLAILGVWLVGRLRRRLFCATNGHPGRLAWPGLTSTSPNPAPAAKGYRYPFTPYPQGWFFALRSRELVDGAAVPLTILGRDLVAWRDGQGLACLSDAHCPHLGAHLGYGGRVNRDGCLTCPFHGWAFDGEGRVASVPYSESELPKSPLLKSYRVVEKNSCVFVWHGADEELFDVPDVPALSDRDFDGYEQRWRCRVHVQEVVENAVDTAHFNVTHAFESVPTIHSFETRDQLFRVHMSCLRTFLWIKDRVQLVITYHGMGVVTAEIDSIFLQLRVLLCGTPLDDEHVEINTLSRFRKSWNPLWNLILKLYLPYHTGWEFYQDIPLWENKVYRTKPLLLKGDGPIPAVRRWCRQFYRRADNDPLQF